MVDSILTNQATVKNCIGWTFIPLPQVGSPVGYLSTTPIGLDSATKVGCKSQSFTSWDCLSRLYVGGVYVHQDEHTTRTTRQTQSDLIGNVPTQEELAALTDHQKLLLERGLKIFVRGKGVMTKKQLQILQAKAVSTDHVKDVAHGSRGGIRTRAATIEAGSSTDGVTDDNTGFYYSDILPARCMSVSSMTCIRETDPMPYSPQYQVLASRLNDPAQTGVLSSVGPNVRDATTMTSLVNAMALRPSTRYEIAAMVRCGAMGMSVAEESFSTDPIPHRFVRKPENISGAGLDILQKPGVVAASWNAVAMPLDSFVALANNVYYGTTPTGYTYGGLDVTWTAVPVPSRLLRQSHVVAYLFSFLDSECWSGTVNYRSVSRRQGSNKPYRMCETYIPTVNSVSIPGVKNVCLVLIDETSANCPNSVKLSLQDTVVEVPTWKGPTVINPVSVWPLWDKFWNKDNIPGIRRDTTWAFSEICTRLGVSDACGTSLSLLAELYGQWYFGIAADWQKDKPVPDYTQAPYGSWTYDGSYLDKTHKFKSNLFNLNQVDKMDARRRSVAYNFSGVSPLHVFPTGVVRIRFVDVGDFLRISWSTQRPEVEVPSYNIQTMTSISRVATAMGLILTHTESYRFASPTEFVHWVHMLSNAISFSTSAFLSINDITPKDWSGIYNKYDVAHRDMVLDTLKSSMYGGLLVHHNVENLFANISEWDLDIMSEYWLLSPYTDINWMTFSPVPAHCTQQWIDKLGLTGGVVPKGVTTFRYKTLPYMAMKISRDHAEHKLNLVTTIDVYRRFPQILAREQGEGYERVLHWVDNVAGYSNAAPAQNRVLAPTDMYESLTFCAGINNIEIPYSDPTEWYVLGSNYEYNDPTLAALKVTPIQWPDPPILETLWQGAKNYILKPAASALAGFLMLEVQQEQQ